MMRIVASLGVLASVATADAGVVRHADRIPDQYIVVMKPTAGGATAAASAIERLARAHAAPIARRYTAALHGFATTLSPDEAERLAADPDVDYVAENGVVRGLAVRTNATFGLDRIDQAALPLDGKFVELGDGAGVTVYVLDSGIRPTHGEFTGRILEGAFAIDDNRGVVDCHGHGTHVSGTIAGTTFGVAPAASIVPVRVLDCNNSGSIDGIIAGIDFVAANATGDSVANLSIGAQPSPAFDAAVRGLVARGVHVVVAAGNDSVDACNQSPARERSVITVAATNSADARAPFSNFGACVDLFAPGAGITSAGLASDTATAVLDGTSMATPHVAGAIAAYLGNHPGATPAEVTAALLAGATPGRISDARGTPNLMLSTRFLDSEPPGGAIVSPVDGARVSPSFSIVAQLVEPNLELVELRLDGRLLETLRSGDVRFQVKDVPAGAHQIELTAVDAAGNSAVAAITVIVGDGEDGDDNGDALTGGCSTSGASGGLTLVGVAAVLGLGLRRRRLALAALLVSACTTGETSQPQQQPDDPSSVTFVDADGDGDADGIDTDGDGDCDYEFPDCPSCDPGDHPSCTDPLVDLDGDGIPEGLDLDCDGGIDIAIDVGPGQDGEDGVPGACNTVVIVNDVKREVTCTYGPNGAATCECRRNDTLVRTCTPTGSQSCGISIPTDPAANCCGDF